MSVYGTGPFYNPLFFSFPDDMNAYQAIQYNVMIGPALKLSVNSDTMGADQVNNKTDFYFPAGIWCNVFVPTEKCIPSTGQNLTLSSKAYDFYLHLYEGNLVMLQNATALNIMTSKELQKYPVDMHILGAAGKQGHGWYAIGSHVNDDGENVTLSNNYNQYSFAATSN